MKQESATAFTTKCFSSEKAPCSFACPFRLDIRSFLGKAAKGRWSSAYRELRTALVFPEVSIALCGQSCEKYCLRSEHGGALNMHAVEKAVISLSKDKKPQKYAIPPKSEKIAVIGAGPSGLACALSLAQKSFTVSIFDSASDLGGSIAARSDFALLREDLLLQLSAYEFDWHFNTTITSLDELAQYDAVYIATGACGSNFGINGQSGKFFTGGELIGVSAAEGIAMGERAALSIEGFLQTQSAVPYVHAQEGEKCTRYVPVSVPDVKERIESETPFEADTAKAEASRCLSCDCTSCLSSCELLKKYKKLPHRMATDVFMDSQARPPITSCSITRQTYSCNDCGYCSSICPEETDIGGLFRFSRADRIQGGRYPTAIHDYWLREMDFAVGEAAFFSAPAGAENCTYAFFPGCRLGASVPEHLLRSYEYLNEKYNAGLILGCCGAPAWWAGDEKRFGENVENIRNAWHKLGEPTLVYACASCKRMLTQALPEIPLVSLYSLLTPVESASPVFEKAAVFDPCASRDDSETRAHVRSLAGESGISVSDFYSGGRCCGYGGQMRLADPALYNQITDNRSAMSEDPYIVWCSNCREVFASKGHPCAHILDIVFGLESTAIPTLQAKKENLISVKKVLMEKYWNKVFEPKTEPWHSISVNIPEEIQEKMERLLLTLEDVQQAIYLAENEQCAFLGDDGTMFCRYVGQSVTVWVNCRKNNSAYDVTNVYCHRMHFREGEQ